MGILQAPLKQLRGKNNMSEDQTPYGQGNDDKLSYEQKVKKLDEILGRLDNSETPIDKLAEDVRLGARFIKELGSKLKQVETEVKDAFKELEEGDEEG